MSKPKICIVTGSRADYGLLYWLIRKVCDDPDCTLHLVVTGMHLSAEYGLTYRAIEEDGFGIDEMIETVLSSDSPVAIAKSVALGVIGFAEVFARLRPNIVILLGDRYEILAAAEAALMSRIPIGHIGGGDVTEGAIDDSIRHAITKMSSLHFVTNADSARRVAQMGEDRATIYLVGSPGIDYLMNLKLLSRVELEASLGIRLREKNLLITFHPPTAEPGSAAPQFRELLDALSLLPQDLGLIFTQTNSDHESRGLMTMTEEFVSQHQNAASFVSLGQLRYVSLLGQVNAVVGNSSSGLYEAPSFKIPTVNVGSRQQGRLQSTSVINVNATAGEIYKGIIQALKMDCSQSKNPFGEGNSSDQILKVIKSRTDLSSLIRKKFVDFAQ